MANSATAIATPATPTRSAADVWLSAVTDWYLTGLLAALGFSFGFYLVRPASGALPERRDWLDAFTWMDGKWYKQIAAEGYHYDPANRSNVAFFPVYPLLGRGLMAVSGLRAEAALLIVSNLSFLAALAMLAFYCRERDPAAPAELADYTLLAAALFPTGCFFRLTYSESTFLLLAILAMYAMLRRWPLWAIALIVGLATAARPVGVALLAPFAIHIWRRCRPHQPEAPARPTDGTTPDHPEAPSRRLEGSDTIAAPRESVEAQLPSPSARGQVRVAAKCPVLFPRSRFGLVCARLALYLPLACWGLTAFFAYQCHAFGDPFAVLKAHGHWGIRADTPWPETAAALATLEPVRSVYDGQSPAFWLSHDTHGIPWFSLQFANPIFFLTAVALVAFGASRRLLSLEETSLGSLLLLIPYVTRGYEMGMGSMGRFVAVVFPIYFVLAQFLVRLPGPLGAALVTLSGALLAIYTALYTAHYVIF